ncbi:MAG: Ubiquitin carboxyl-terminal hydrolase 10 [Vezdaea aestivalis]|nr:MAG: Ubiquitin carboxyl-terminal hydrolase 10 [Vezdaea aestivalis]
MNHHLPAVPPVPGAGPPYQGRRHGDMPYGMPPNPHLPPMGYHGYHQQHQAPQGHPYAQQHFQQWNQYPPAYPPPPTRPYSQGPLIVSSYPPPPPPLHQLAPRHVQPPPRPTSSTQSQAIASPTTSTTSFTVPTPSPTDRITPSSANQIPPRPQSPFSPSLPWLSVPDEPFPPRAPRRRRRRRALSLSASPVQFPSQEIQTAGSESSAVETQLSAQQLNSDTETPQTSHPPSEVDPIPHLSTPATSPVEKHIARPKQSIVPIIPVLPAIPNLPKHTSKESIVTVTSLTQDARPPTSHRNRQSTSSEAKASTTTDGSAQSAAPAVKEPPKSWADLVRKNAVVTSAEAKTDHINGSASILTHNKTKAGSLSEALLVLTESDMSVQTSKVSFLEPRGLVNTGNMCYMNSVLQILVFCVPFYNFLDRVGKQVAHKFKSDTPLLDAMIMFMREFGVIDSAESAPKLKMRLKDRELEQYGEAFTPEFVYDVIRRLPRFSTMRRGHQQDAEEFLGFLLEGLHDECVMSMKQSLLPNGQAGAEATAMSPRTQTLEVEYSNSQKTSNDTGDGWLEVGPKQRPSITRSSGATAESPITKIFGGKLRSELRIPGLKTSVTLEPYQPLQLDIQSPQIHNITDALKGLTRSERLHWDFNSPKGKDVVATKQVFIETLPPVLILHLKRFQYNNSGGTQKIWKKIGYPLELEIPKEVFSQAKRGALLNHGGLPKYRLIGVVYHHGKNASGGHYTVDVHRQDGAEWIRLDDTAIRRIRSQEVAAGGTEEDVDSSSQPNQRSPNPVADDDSSEYGQSGKVENGWKQVNGGNSSQQTSGSPKALSGSSTPTGRNDRYSFKDNKVAYILFYQKV